MQIELRKQPEQRQSVRKIGGRDATGIFACGVPVIDEARANEAADYSAAHAIGADGTGVWADSGWDE